MNRSVRPTSSHAGQTKFMSKPAQNIRFKVMCAFKFINFNNSSDMIMCRTVVWDPKVPPAHPIWKS